MKETIIIDCDPGHDDAVALMLAVANNDLLDLKCVSTVGGNQDIKKVTRNAQNILGLFNKDIPLVVGRDRPLINELETAGHAHGESGMDGPQFVETDYPLVEEHAQHYLYDTIMTSTEKVTLVALGPLTNIALLILNYPELKDKIKQIVFMGGGIDKGNATASAEFNIYIDPHAAKIVFNSGIPLVMAGLNITEELYLTKSEIDQWKNGGPIHHIYWEILSFYYESGKQFGFEHSAIHDVVPIAYLLRPEIFTGHYYPLNVILEGDYRGTTLADKRLKPDTSHRALILETGDRESFKALINDALKEVEGR